MKKVLRVCCKAGRYSFRYVLEDADGDVVKVLRDELETSFRDMSEVHELTDEMKLAVGLPVFHIVAANKRMLGFCDE